MEKTTAVLTGLGTPPQNKDALKVSFIPWYSGQNPYQNRLVEQLDELGVKVEGSRCSTASLAKTVQAHSSDVLHLHWLQHFYLLDKQSYRCLLKLALFLVQLLIIRLRGVKIVWTIHDLKNPMNEYLILDYVGAFLVARISDQLIVHSETAKADVVKKFLILNQKRISVTPHASYIGDYDNTVTQGDARTTLDLPASSIVFLFFGLIFPYKGVLELAQAFVALDSPDAVLVIAGQPMDAELEHQITALVADCDRIRYFPKFIPDDEVQVYMNACDVVAFPYKQSLTSGAVSLGMSFGRACLAPEFGYLAEILDDQGAFFYDPKATDGLIQALEIAIGSRDRLLNMGAYNYEQASQATWASMANITLEVYRSV